MQDTWNPAQYDKFKQERSLPFFDLLNLVKPRAKMRIIDLGCGTGELTTVLHEKLKADSTIGVDNSASMLAKARQHKFNGLSFENSDIVNFRAANTFDLIFANASIQWCTNHAAIFRSFAESLKPEGQLAIQMPMNHDYPTHTIAYALAEEWRLKRLINAEPRASNLLNAEDYAQLLFNLQFEQQNIFVKVYSHILPTRDDVIEWVQGTLLTYYQSLLSANLFEQFLREYKERLFQILPETTPFFYPFKRILIWGQRN